MTRMKLYVLFTGLLLSASVFAQSEVKVVKDSLQVIHTESMSVPVPVLQPVSDEFDSNKEQPVQLSFSMDTVRTFSLHPEYWLLPWDPRIPSSNPIFRDYVGYNQFGKVHAYSSRRTMPTMGALSYMRFLYSFDLTKQFHLYSGAFAAQYLLGPKINTDFGLDFGIGYDISDRASLNLLYQHSFRQKIIGVKSQIAPMFPNNGLELNLELKSKKGMNVKVGIMKDLSY